MEINPSDLNWFDITVISVICASTLFAVLRGFIKAVFSLFTWVTSSLIAVALYPHVFPLISPHVQSEKSAMALSSFGVFILFFIIIAIIVSKIVHSMDGIRGGIVDRTLGLAFGGARGILIVCLAFFSIHTVSKMLHFGGEERPGPSWFAKAETYEALQITTDKVFAMLPADVPKEIVAQIDKFKEMSVSMMSSGEEDADSTGLPRTLNPEEWATMKKVMAVLPKEDLITLQKKYENDTSGMSEIEKLAMFREIVGAYSEAVKANKVPEDKLVGQGEVDSLDTALNGRKDPEPEVVPEQPKAEEPKTEQPKLEGPVGYKEENIKQLDRLVENVQVKN
jgi:membrane protein required for colicin V production